MNIVVSILLALLPETYRERFGVHAVPSQGGLVGGLLEALSALFLLIHGYHSYTTQRLAAIDVTIMTKAAEKGGESAVMGLGSLLLLEYALHPLTLLLVFLVVEGIVRIWTAAVSGESLPSFPLYLLSLLHTRLNGTYQEKRMGKRISDDVQCSTDGASLHIASCRPKEWNQLTTVSYDDRLYELVRTKEGVAPRPFVYILRKKPVMAVIRGIYHYHPDEVLEAGQRNRQ
jgi:hypothetical protein